jgi:hypothetical protein
MHLRTAALPLAAAALVATVAAPASAEQQRLVDPQGDMWVVADDGSSVPAPESAQGDVTRARTSYRGDAIVVRLKFVDLARRGAYAQYAVVLQGHRDLRTREVVVEAGPDRWEGRARVYKPHGDLVTSCPVAHRIDYDTETVRVRVDRACLDKPGSVRASINVYRADDTGAFYSDNPHDSLDHSDAWTPWVHRTR